MRESLHSFQLLPAVASKRSCHALQSALASFLDAPMHGVVCLGVGDGVGVVGAGVGAGVGFVGAGVGAGVVGAAQPVSSQLLHLQNIVVLQMLFV